MRVLRASLDHLPDAAMLLREYYEDVGVTQRDTPEEIRAFLTNAGSGLWIAYAGQVPAGCVVLRPLPSVDRAAECKRLYVRPRFRGQGIADRLLDAIEEYAQRIGSAFVYLDSKDDLAAAIRIYVRRGYVECERYNNNPQATLFLRRNLALRSDV